MHNLKQSIALVLSLAIGSLAATDTAWACGNGVEYEISYTVEQVSDAETELNAGRNQGAVNKVLVVFPRPKRLVLGRGGRSDRALRVVAAATVRLGGEVSAAGFTLGSPRALRDNLQWAENILQRMSQKQPEDVALQTLLAEARAQFSESRADAMRVLTQLEHEDRMVGAQGYAALARLRRNVGGEQLSFVRAPLRQLHRVLAERAEMRCWRMSHAEYCVSPQSEVKAG